MWDLKKKKYIFFKLAAEVGRYHANNNGDLWISLVVFAQERESWIVWVQGPGLLLKAVSICGEGAFWCCLSKAVSF